MYKNGLDSNLWPSKVGQVMSYVAEYFFITHVYSAQDEMSIIKLNRNRIVYSLR